METTTKYTFDKDYLVAAHDAWNQLGVLLEGEDKKIFTDLDDFVDFYKLMLIEIIDAEFSS